MSDVAAPQLTVAASAGAATPAEESRSHPASGFTVADLCRRWRVGEAKIHGFLRRGELVGVNLASSLLAKPQWRITPESLREFEQRRTSKPTPKPQRRRRRPPILDFYP